MGSMITTPNQRKSYGKTSSKPRMKIDEKYRVTSKWVSGNVHQDTYETERSAVKSRGPSGFKKTGKVIVPAHKETSTHPFVMRTQGGRDIPKDVWDREKYWGTYSEVKKRYN